MSIILVTRHFVVVAIVLLSTFWSDPKGAQYSSAAAQTPKASSSSSFVVGVLVSQDDDGWNLLPVARFDGRWTNPWPKPLREDERPILPSPKAIPRAWLGGTVPLSWMVWSPDGSSRRAQVSQVSRLSGCEGAIVLRTQSAVARTMTLAFDRIPAVEAVIDVQAFPLESDEVLTQLGDIFVAAEEKSLTDSRRSGAVGGDPASYPLAAPPDIRRTVPIEIRRLFRVIKDASEFVYYIEALKRFQTKSAGTDLVTLSGWLRSSQRRISAIDVEAGNGLSAEYRGSRTPLGIVRVEGQQVWVSYVEASESAFITLTDLSGTAAKSLIVANVSGC